jgi:hypothetical protein
LNVNARGTIQNAADALSQTTPTIWGVVEDRRFRPGDRRKLGECGTEQRSWAQGACPLIDLEI